MKATVFFTLQEADGAVLQDHTAVVVDVLRASSTIVAALAAGAHAIYPVVSTEEAIKLATSLGREDALLAGERRGLKVEGFDLGNSPREFTPETVGGKRVVMSTTNGTRALVAVAGAERVLVASFLNLSAVAAACADAERLAVVCAGREGRFSIDDAVCAGMLLGRLKERLGARWRSRTPGVRCSRWPKPLWSTTPSSRMPRPGGRSQRLTCWTTWPGVCG